MGRRKRNPLTMIRSSKTRTAEYEKNIAAATTDSEKKTIERKYKNTLAQLKAQKAIDVKWVSEWHASDTYNVAIGQGRQNYTPLQLARYCATIANGGKIMKPYVVDHVQDKNGNVILKNEPELIAHSAVSDNTFKIVEDAMTEFRSQAVRRIVYFMISRRKSK